MEDRRYSPEEASRPRVKLVASTGDVARPTANPDLGDGAGAGAGDAGELRSYFETARWTADGTTLLTYASTDEISAYVMPADLLAPRAPDAGGALELAKPPRRASVRLPERSAAHFAGAPYFSLAEPWTNQVLVSARDHPIQLFYLLPSPPSSSSLADDEGKDEENSTSPCPSPAASYPFIKARSETFLSASSLLWPSGLGSGSGGGASGTHFLAGARNLLAKFDVSRPGASSEPVLRIKTIPSERHLSKGGGVGMRGVVSALGAQPYTYDFGAGTGTGTGLVAAGTWTRWVGLYDFASAGQCVATWSVASAASEPLPCSGDGEEDRTGDAIGGSGISQTIWSPCGRYLVIGERRSRGLLVYDVRVTGRLLGCLVGSSSESSPHPETNQRILCDVFPGVDNNGFEVWSGGGGGGPGGGIVRVWEGVGTREGAHLPSWDWRAHDDGASTVGSTSLHPSGSVVATCAGSWAFPEDEDEDEDMGEDGEGDGEGKGMGWLRRRNRESSLKIWSLVGGDDDVDGGDDGGGDGQSRDGAS